MRHLVARLSRARAARLSLALLLALFISGTPGLALAALGFEEPDCLDDCSQSLLDTDACPSSCTVGRCGQHLVVTALAPAAPLEVPVARQAAPAREQLPPREPIGNRVFQPPRR